MRLLYAASNASEPEASELEVMEDDNVLDILPVDVSRPDVMLSSTIDAVANPMPECSRDVWLYEPKRHKTEHHGNTRQILIGPRAQRLLASYLLRPPNTGAAPWSSDYRTHEEARSSLNYGVYNLGPCPIPGGKLMFTSNRNAHVPPRG